MYNIFLLEPGAKVETKKIIYSYIDPSTKKKVYKAITIEEKKNAIELPPQGLPEELEMAVKVANMEDSILNIGDVIQPGIPGLREYKLEFMLPNKGAEFKPIHYLNFFRAAIEQKKILRLIITRMDMENNDIYETNIQVVITQYNVKERFGCVGDQFVDMTLKEYREHGVDLLKA